MNFRVIKNNKTESHVLGFINRNFHNKSKNIVLPLYKYLARHHLKYVV